MKMLLAAIMASVLISSAYAVDEQADYVKAGKYKSIGYGLTKGDAVALAKDRYPDSRLLSVSRNENGGVDCLVVKLIRHNGEFKTVYIECYFK